MWRKSRARWRPPIVRGPFWRRAIANGLISLDANGDAISYSLGGQDWQNYAAPFSFARGGTLQLKSNAKNGQNFESAVPMNAFLDRRAWKASASDFQNGEGNPQNAIDGDSNTFWHSRYSPDKPDLPHCSDR